VSGPSPLPDLAEGPECIHGVAVQLDECLTRLTAPNPSIMTGPGTNSYVVGDDEVVVIDPGPDDKGHLAALVREIAGRTVRAVAVTHHHSDHAPGARALADQVRAPVVGYGHAQLEVDVQALEGMVLTAGSWRLVAWFTPGHASDHVCFLEPSRGWLFTGDHLMQGSTVTIFPPDGDLTAYLENVARVRDDHQLLRLAPGHGRVLAPPQAAAAAVLEHRAQRAAIVLQALRDHGPGSAAALVPYAYADVGPERTVVATATCWAHLLGLEDDGIARREGARDDPDARFELIVT
jgi:glyoxylase-like metal-dependent hydrolase (beta-lactamase superfamily II)